MGSLTVRVIPRSRQPGIALDARGITIRVRRPPQDGEANEEARIALARAIGIPTSAVTLRRGRRTREKVFELDGITGTQALQRLRN